MSVLHNTQAHTFANHTGRRTDQSLQKSVLLASARAKAKNKKFPPPVKNKAV
jgi:hypothetical protein